MKKFNWTPEESLKVSIKPKVKVITFGDGYEQRIADGINNQLREYSLNFSGEEAEIRKIDQFLAEHGAIKAFLWTP